MHGVHNLQKPTPSLKCLSSAILKFHRHGSLKDMDVGGHGMHVATVLLPRLDFDQDRGHFRLIGFGIFDLLATDRR